MYRFRSVGKKGHLSRYNGSVVCRCIEFIPVESCSIYSLYVPCLVIYLLSSFSDHSFVAIILCLYCQMMKSVPSLCLSVALKMVSISLSENFLRSNFVLFRVIQIVCLKIAVAVSLLSSSVLFFDFVMLLRVIVLFIASICLVLSIAPNVCFDNCTALHSKKMCFSVSCIFCLHI